MKNFLNIILSLAVAASVFSCGKKDNPMPSSKATISVDQTSLQFDPSGGTKTVSVTSSGPWTASASESWISVSPQSGTASASVSVSAGNNTVGDRSGKVIFTSSADKTVSASVALSQPKAQAGETVTIVASPAEFDGTKRAGTTYQLLVYSFADSDGDGIGDFNGITQKLDYLDDMGVTALWLSPIHPAASYHGYDVTDYYSVNSEYGTEADLKNLIGKAKAKGIGIYLDYVLNHSASAHPWFQSAKSSASSKYRDYYIFSADPEADIKAGKIAMIPKNGYDAGQWFPAVSGSASSMKVKFTLGLDSGGKPATLKVEQVDEISNSGTQNSGIWLYYGNKLMTQFYTSGGSTCTLSLEITSDWGVLVRTSQTLWDSYKYGAPSGSNTLEWGKALTLSNTDNSDILLPGMSTLMYHSHLWTSWFADFNYGAASTSETSPAFKDLASSADKWINLGVSGFRLDAVKHIYWNADSDENPTFLGKWYSRCNATWKAAGHSDDLYMVGEVFSEAGETVNYYKGLPSVFEFSFWWRLADVLNNQSGNAFASTIAGYHSSYRTVRKDAVPALKLSNHDEDRAASTLGKSLAKEKQAAAFLLTAEGKPFIYQGEELGYWGTKSNGDEYVRAPMKWTKTGSVAAGKLSGKVDNSMLSASISVEAQKEDPNSLMNVYRTFSELRNTYPALASGTMSPTDISVTAIASWYMTSSDGQKMLVIHNVASSSTKVQVSDSMSRPVALLGTASYSGKTLTLGANSSVVFLL